MSYTGLPLLEYANGQSSAGNVPLAVDLSGITLGAGAGLITHMNIYTKNGTNITSVNYPIQDIVPTTADNYMVSVPFDCAFDWVALQVFYSDGESQISATLSTFCPPTIPVISGAVEDAGNDHVVVVIENNTDNNGHAFIELRYNVYYSYTDTSGNAQFGNNHGIVPTYDSDASGAASSHRYVDAISPVPDAIGSIYVNVQEMVYIISGPSAGAEITGPLNAVANDVDLGGVPFPPVSAVVVGTNTTRSVDVSFGDSLHQSLIPIGHYVIQRSDDGAAFVDIATIPQGTTNGTHTHTDPGLPTGVTYAYRVKAVSIGGLSSTFISGDATAAFSQLVDPTSVVVAQSSAASDGALGPTMTVTWEDPQPGVNYFDVFASANGANASIGTVTYVPGQTTYQISHTTNNSFLSYEYTIVIHPHIGASVTTPPVFVSMINMGPITGAAAIQLPGGASRTMLTWIHPLNTQMSSAGPDHVRLINYSILDGSLNLVQGGGTGTADTVVSWYSPDIDAGSYTYVVRAHGVNGAYVDSAPVTVSIAAPSTIDYTDADTNVVFTVDLSTGGSHAQLSWPPLTASATATASIRIFSMDPATAYTTPVATLAGTVTTAALREYIPPPANTSSLYNSSITYRVYSLSSFHVSDGATDAFGFPVAPYTTVAFTTPNIDAATGIVGAQTTEAGTVDLSWALPANRHGGGGTGEVWLDTIGYDYHLISNPSINGTVSNLSSTTVSATTGVLANGAYSFTITAYSPGGTSATSSPFTVNVIGASSATNLTATGASNTVYGSFQNPTLLNGTDPSHYVLGLYAQDASGNHVEPALHTAPIQPYIVGSGTYYYDFNNVTQTPGTFRIFISLWDTGAGSGAGDLAAISVTAINRPIINSFSITSDGVVNAVIYGNNQGAGAGQLLDFIVVPISASGDVFYNIAGSAVETDDAGDNVGQIYTVTNLNLGTVGTAITAGDVTHALALVSNSSGATAEDFTAI